MVDSNHLNSEGGTIRAKRLTCVGNLDYTIAFSDTLISHLASVEGIWYTLPCWLKMFCHTNSEEFTFLSPISMKLILYFMEYGLRTSISLPKGYCWWSTSTWSLQWTVGLMSYFPADDFSFRLTFTNWGIITRFTTEHSLIFIPIFGPVYNDLQVHLWNKMTSCDRKNEVYYREGFGEALEYSRGGDKGHR